MIRHMSAVVALMAVAGCSGGATATVQPPSLDAFVGQWRSVTPSLEFMGLSFYSRSSELGTLGTRLTFSGIAWDGSGRIDGDSVVAGMIFSGTSESSGVIVARAPDAHTLRVQVRPAGAPVVDLTFVRED